MKKKTYKVVGVMSGTSLDGLDLAMCLFSRHNGKWQYRLEKAVTYTYSEAWKERLETAHTLGAQSLIALHKDYGRHIGRAVASFLEGDKEVDLIASHGHTVFHEPAKGITCQIGDGNVISAECSLTTVWDFRSLDVALGGQGAPLVPAGDELLFGSYDYCLNLGGFSNISYNNGINRLAFDICPVNIVLNKIAQEKGIEYDDKGSIGRTGKVDEKTLELLDQLPYYRIKGPKSLGREWVENDFMPIIGKSGLNSANKLRTVYEHIFRQFLNVVEVRDKPTILVTGGGAFNSFLLELLATSGANLFVPGEMIVKYKEALIFAFLGLLRLRNEINCLSSVTGASGDSSSGTLCHIIRNG